MISKNQKLLAIACAIVVFPTLILFSNLYCYCNHDWQHHIWTIGYIGNYFRAHFAFPATMSADNLLNYPMPAFYSYVFYMLAGFLSAIMPPDFAVRICVLGVLTAQFILIERLVFRLTQSRAWAYSASALILWAIYSLTNLYNRAALPEFMSAGLLTAAVAGWFMLITSEKKSEMITYAIVTALTMSAGLGTHPITTMYAIPTMNLIALASIPLILERPSAARKTIVSSVLGILLFSALVDAPMLYLSAAYSKKLSIAGHPYLMFDSTNDELVFRFMPFPIDGRSIKKGLEVGTPYLDTQTNVALLALILGLAYLARKAKRAAAATPLLVLSAGAFVVFTWLSLRPLLFGVLPEMAKIVQFPYRLVAFENLMLITGLVALLFAFKRSFKFDGRSTAQAVLLTACVTTALLGTLVKFSHARAVRAIRPAVWGESFTTMTANFPISAYTTTEFKPLSDADSKSGMSVTLPLGVPELAIDVDQAKWVKTNLTAFSWNSLEVDGIRIPAAETRQDSWREAVRLQPGHHVLRAVFSPDPIWVWLRRLSILTFTLGALVAAFSCRLISNHRIFS